MQNAPLGRLEKVALRDVWGNEFADFTPWLAQEENVRLLGDTLGMELEFVTREKGVGRYAADLLCKDTATGHHVLVENQLGPTDHSHLGQVLTYCAGIDGAGQEVRTAIWIAAQFTEEHRAALDWLNEISGERFQFFGLEVELWRIAGSPVAPKFNVIARPNAWSRAVGEAVSARSPRTETAQRQLEYWTAFHLHLETKSKVLRPQKPAGQSWMDLSLGRSGFNLSAVASNYDLVTQRSEEEDQIRAVVNITKEPADGYFTALHAEKDKIGAEFGEPLTWYSAAGVASRRVFVSKRVNLADRAAWPEQHEWLRVKLERLHQVFGPRVKTLAPAQPVADGGSGAA